MALTTNKLDITYIRLQTKEQKVPIVEMQIEYTVGRFPTVVVVVDDGITINDAETIETNPEEGMPPDPDNINNDEYDNVCNADGATLAHIKIGIRNDEGKDAAFTLFSGYVVEKCPVVNSNPVSVRCVTKYKLVCGTEMLNTTPPGNLRYLSTYINPDLSHVEFSVLTNKAKFARQVAATFVQEPSKALALVLDNILNFFQIGDQKRVSGVVSSVRHAAGSMVGMTKNDGASVTGIAYNSLETTIATLAADALKRLSPSAAYASLLGQFYLGWLPQTVSDGVNANKMIVRSVSGWEPFDKNSTITLTARDIIGFASTTSYNHDATVDRYCVSIPYSSTRGIPRIGSGRVAVYKAEDAKSAEKATAVVLSGADYIKAERENTTFASLRVIGMPEWVWQYASIASYSNNNKNETAPGSGTPIPSANTPLVNKAVEDMAKYLAILSFLQNGRSATSTLINIPLIVWLRLLPFLGDMIKIALPDLTYSNKADIDRLDTDVYFGGLNGLLMSITTNGKTISVNCSASLVQVHTVEEQKKYATGNPLYPNQSNGQNEALELVTKL